ncbi:MAG: acyltransferase [Rhodoferax sp.]|nr:acyltransferase [Rhodoferax sp.]
MRRIKTWYPSLRNEIKRLVLWFVGEFPVARCLLARALPSLFVSIGSNCSFGQDVFITGGGGVRIGDWVGLGPDVKIWSVNHRFDDANRPWMLQGWNHSEVVIEDDVWLAANVFVMPGTTIGRGAIIAASSVVNKSVPAYALFAGNPGRVVGWRKRPEDAVTPASATQPIPADTRRDEEEA